MKITQSQLKSLVRTIVKESASELGRTKRKNTLKEAPSRLPTKGGYMVLESDGHNTPLLHKFRDIDQFFEHLVNIDSRFTSFSPEDYAADGNSWVDENGNHWTEFDGRVDHDHTSEK